MTKDAPPTAVRIRQLEDRAEIADLIHRYALYVRTGRSDEIADLFTQDAAFQVRQTEGPASLPDYVERSALVGRDAIRAYFAATAGRTSRTVPLIRNILIELKGDIATSTCLMNSRTWPAGAEVFGEYHDSFQRTDTWQFSSRIFTLFGKPAPAS